MDHRNKKTAQHPVSVEAAKVGMSLRDVCHSAGVSRTTLLRAVSDPTANPTLRTVERVARALAICPGDLVDQWLRWIEEADRP